MTVMKLYGIGGGGQAMVMEQSTGIAKQW